MLAKKIIFTFSASTVDTRHFEQPPPVLKPLAVSSGGGVGNVLRRPLYQNNIS